MRQRVTIAGTRRAMLEMLSSPLDRTRELSRHPIDAMQDVVEVSYLIDGDVRVEPVERYVQVEFLDAHPVTGEITHGYYTYIDGTKSGLVVGDLVVAPTRYKSRNRAIVRALGPNIDTYEGVTQRITKLLATTPAARPKEDQ